MGSPRARFGSVVRGGKIYVVGGKRGFRKKDQLRNIEVYDPKTDREELNDIFIGLPFCLSELHGSLVAREQTTFVASVVEAPTVAGS